MRNRDYLYYDIDFKDGSSLVLTKGRYHGCIGINDSEKELRDKLISEFGYYLEKQYYPMDHVYFPLIPLVKTKPIEVDGRINICDVVDFAKKIPILHVKGMIAVVFGNSEMLKEVHVPEAKLFKSGNRWYAVSNPDDECCQVTPRSLCNEDDSDMERYLHSELF